MTSCFEFSRPEALHRPWAFSVGGLCSITFLSPAWLRDWADRGLGFERGDYFEMAESDHLPGQPADGDAALASAYGDGVGLESESCSQLLVTPSSLGPELDPLHSPSRHLADMKVGGRDLPSVD